MEESDVTQIVVHRKGEDNITASHERAWGEHPNPHGVNWLRIVQDLKQWVNCGLVEGDCPIHIEVVERKRSRTRTAVPIVTIM